MEASSRPPLLVFVLGAPGAGKGTQCGRVVEKYAGWGHVSAGDLLRAEVASGSEAGRQAEAIMKEGKMVPASMIIGLLRAAIARCGQPRVLIDGFPRKLDQLREFEATVGPCRLALFYSVSEAAARERLRGRGASSGRVDDNEETMAKRFVVFTEESMPVVDALRSEGRLAEVDAGGSPDEVFAATRAVIERLEAEHAAAAAPAPAPAAEGAAGAAAAAGAAGAAAGAAAAAAGAAAAAAPPPGGGVQMDLSGIRTPIVVCGPSGVGKGTLIAKLMARWPDRFGFSVSHTTRAPRPGEAHGSHYYFTDPGAMTQQVGAGMFLEHAVVHGQMYGTSLAAVARVSSEGKHCVLDIDVQGAAQARHPPRRARSGAAQARRSAPRPARAPAYAPTRRRVRAAQVRASALGRGCLFIFIAPPSHAELERRLRARGTESEEKIRERLANAQAEIAKAQDPGLFDHTLVNGDLEAAFAQLQALIAARCPGLMPELQPPAPPHANGAPAPLANGGAAPPAAAAVAGAAAAGAAAPATAALLDFGFGAAAGPGVAAKGMPVRAYMDATVIPVLREGLKALNLARPDDPLQYLADFLLSHKAAPA
ncbi:GK1 [Scenedesmus sp. PABB004]|nr:GK1 [Scenedesmus sp. PABB004]